MPDTPTETQRPAPPASGEPPAERGWSRLFRPILAGATLRERIVACLGALLGIALTALICRAALGSDPHLPFIVAPLGASAVLLFAVPASPLAQPWSIVGGNTISALAGVFAAHVVRDPILAMGATVALAILAMSLTRCLHPPGGAAALTAVIGGPAVASAGYLFPLAPVGLNSLLLVLFGLAFHKATRRAYPHRAATVAVQTHKTADPPAQARVGFTSQDVDAALAAVRETFDISRADIDALLRQVELQALKREHADLACADIMSRDVVRTDPDATTEAARRLLLDHAIRTLPVTDADGRLLGTVGLRELQVAAERVGAVVSPASLSDPDAPAVSLLGPLTDGRTHAVVVVDADQRVLGLITQTDLLAAMARRLGRQGTGRPA